jgi:hypothetical protein
MMIENMMNKPLSPGEIAVAKEAASWAAEQHNMVSNLSAATLSFQWFEWYI